MSRRSEQVGFFAALHAAGVEYAVVGGVAVNAHGFVRNTRDLGIFFRPTAQNAGAVFRALESLGAPLQGSDATDLLNDTEHYQLDTEHGRIDLLASIGEVSFAQVWRCHVTAEIDGVVVRFISPRKTLSRTSAKWGEGSI